MNASPFIISTPAAISCIFTFNFAADFRDLFEIRGIKRARRGEITTQLEDQRLTFRYQGLDGITRVTDIHLDPKPDRLSESHAAFAFDLKAEEQCAIVLTVRCGTTDPQTMNFSEPYRAARRAAQKAAELGGTVTSSNALANRMMHRAGADLSMLITQTAEGPYPYAGTPWFSTPFGRDGLITALQMLWIDPSIAQGVLRYLARTQATKIDPKADAEPGKILHETRACEMANLGEVPFGRYYGSIDSTPLFVLLASRYFLRTGDQVTIRALWPHLKAALEWIDRYGDRDGDGFVEYYRESEDGLANQGWKDSYDSIFHEDGRLATGSIALCEVQAYVYAAKKGAAVMAAHAGRACPRRPAGRRCGKTAREIRGGVLVRGFGRLCHRAGRREKALPGAHLQCRAGAGWRHRLARARRAAGRDADDAGNVLGLGRAHRGRRMLPATIPWPIMTARSGRMTIR